jgi:hypothetical protein
MVMVIPSALTAVQLSSWTAGWDAVCQSGFITEARRLNVPLGDVMAMSGHRSVGSAMRYFRAGSATDSKAARLLGDSEPET